MSQSGGRSCTQCCCSFIFTAGLSALFLWLSLRVSKPKCSLQDFYIPALNKTLNSTTNTTLYFHLRLENTNKDKGVYYDEVNVTFFDSPNKSHTIANYTIPAFYQGHKKKATKGPENGVPTNWDVISKAAFPNGTAVFRVDLTTAVKYKILFWKTKKKDRIMVGGVVVVNNGTKSDPKKRLKLSGASRVGGFLGLFGIVLVNVLAFVLLYQ